MRSLDRRAAAQDNLGDLMHSRHIDPFTLLNGQWMTRWFEFDKRPLPYRSRMDVSLEIQRLRVDGQKDAKPPEVGRLVFAARRLPLFTHSFEILLAQRNPDVPNEWRRS